MTVMEGEFEWIEFIGLAAFTYAELYDTGYSIADYSKDPYLDFIRKRVKPHFSERTLMNMRFVIFGLITTSIFMFWREREDQEKQIFDSVMGLYICNIVLNKFWMAVFFGMHRFKLGAIMASLLLMSSVTIVILMGVMKHFWLSFGLFMPYILWCLMITYISFIYAKESYKTPLSAFNSYLRHSLISKKKLSSSAMGNPIKKSTVTTNPYAQNVRHNPNVSQSRYQQQ